MILSPLLNNMHRICLPLAIQTDVWVNVVIDLGDGRGRETKQGREGRKEEETERESREGRMAGETGGKAEERRRGA